MLSPSVLFPLLRVWGLPRLLQALSLSQMVQILTRSHLARRRACAWGLTPPVPPRRFAKLLLRLPALRSIGLKCLEHLFFFKLIGDTPIDTFLMEMLEAPHQLT